MLKKLLLTAALLSSTFGAHEYLDPDFSILKNRSEALHVDETGVAIDIGQSKLWILSRLTESDMTSISASSTLEELSNARGAYLSNIIYIKTIHTILNAATTPHNGVSKTQDAALLSQLFWNRVSFLKKTLEAMLLSPQLLIDDSTGIIKKHQENLTTFSAKYDPADTTPFIYGNHEKLEQLVDEFTATYGF